MRMQSALFLLARNLFRSSGLDTPAERPSREKDPSIPTTKVAIVAISDFKGVIC